MLQIGSYFIPSQTVLAPMAGVSDLPFRSMCSKLGAGLVVNEMITSDTSLWHTHKSQSRLSWDASFNPRSVQIAGSDPQQMASAAASCVELGAQIVDINMGCPAKKVCSKAAGSALLKDEALVSSILRAVVASVDVPVTLKIRTGWDTETKNGIEIARIAEGEGISALTVHGRTRACRFNGTAEYDTIAKIVESISIPVIANGDIDSPQKARDVLNYTQASAVMIGRAAQGNPWLFREINHYLATGSLRAKPNLVEVKTAILEHFNALHSFYGEHLGTRITRKHMGWYLQKHIDTIQRLSEKHLNSDQIPRMEYNCGSHLNGDLSAVPTRSTTDKDNFSDSLNRAYTYDWRKRFNTLTSKQKQLNAVQDLFDRLHQLKDHAA